MSENTTPTAPLPPRQMVEGVRHVIAVGSAKGGVGKSTVAVNLAFALQKLGAKVGLMDADIHGPSIPVMLGVKKEPHPDVMGRIRAVMAHDIPIMSIGFMVKDAQPLVWRGPMLFQVLQQFFHQVKWVPFGEFLDFLIIDLPPGTGDIQLSMCQMIEVSGAVIVTTPQEVALSDVRRGIALFELAKTPILGVVENMSHFLCPHCHERTDIFASGGGKGLAETLGLPLLAEIPLEPAIRECGDRGLPLVLARPDSPQTAQYLELGQKLLDRFPVAPPPKRRHGR